jgi:hypothetical protein
LAANFVNQAVDINFVHELPLRKMKNEDRQHTNSISSIAY